MFFIIHDVCGGSRHKLGLQRAQNKDERKTLIVFLYDGEKSVLPKMKQTNNNILELCTMCDHWSSSRRKNLLSSRVWVFVGVRCEAHDVESSRPTWCHWCCRDCAYRSKWAFVSRWWWPAPTPAAAAAPIGSAPCRPKCCIPMAWGRFILGYILFCCWLE